MNSDTTPFRSRPIRGYIQRPSLPLQTCLRIAAKASDSLKCERSSEQKYLLCNGTPPSKTKETLTPPFSKQKWIEQKNALLRNNKSALKFTFSTSWSSEEEVSPFREGRCNGPSEQLLPAKPVTESDSSISSEDLTLESKFIGDRQNFSSHLLGSTLFIKHCSSPVFESLKVHSSNRLELECASRSSGDSISINLLKFAITRFLCASILFLFSITIVSLGTSNLPRSVSDR